MSHVTLVDTEIKDLDALRKACVDLGLEFKGGHKRKTRRRKGKIMDLWVYYKEKRYKGDRTDYLHDKLDAAAKKHGGRNTGSGVGRIESDVSYEFRTRAGMNRAKRLIRGLLTRRGLKHRFVMTIEEG